MRSRSSAASPTASRATLFFFMACTMAGMGLPATSGFVSEFLVLVGALHVNFWLALFGSLGMVLGVAYSLYLYRWIMFCKLTKATLSAIQDLSPHEVVLFRPPGRHHVLDGHLPVEFQQFLGSHSGENDRGSPGGPARASHARGGDPMTKRVTAFSAEALSDNGPW